MASLSILLCDEYVDLRDYSGGCGRSQLRVGIKEGGREKKEFKGDVKDRASGKPKI
jgi:hypothetical protein